MLGHIPRPTFRDFFWLNQRNHLRQHEKRGWRSIGTSSTDHALQLQFQPAACVSRRWATAVVLFAYKSSDYATGNQGGSAEISYWNKRCRLNGGGLFCTVGATSTSWEN
jgi:hypothetical protein